MLTVGRRRLDTAFESKATHHAHRQNR